MADGTIDIVATDHAPHPAEDKDCEWASAAFGMVGLETAFGVVVTTMIETGLMDWDRLVQVMSINPAQIAGYGDQGRNIASGNIANITVVDPKKVWQVDRGSLVSRSSNTPFHGSTLTGAVVHTIYRGALVLKDQKLNGEGSVSNE